MADQEAEVLLQVPRADIDEITQPEGAPPNIGSRRTVVHGTELLVLELVFTEDQLKEAAGQLSVDPSVLAAAPGEPIVVLVCGEYRVPLLANVAVRRSTPHNYVFYLPNLPIGVNLDPSTGSEVLEAFEFVIKSYSQLQPGSIPPLVAGAAAAAAPAAAAPAAPAYQARDAGMSMPPPAPAGAPAPAGSVYGAPPQPGMYQPPPQQAMQQQAGPPPVSPHASLEEQQKAALEAAKAGVVYAPPRNLPGSSTFIVQTHPDLPEERTSTRIAHGIGEYARKATELIAGGSDLGAKGVRSGAQAVVEHTDKTEKPVQVPESVRGHVRRTRMLSRGAVAVSGGFAATVVGVTSVVSDQVSKRLKPHVPAGTPSAEPSTLDDVKEVGVAAVGAAALVTDAAMDAARTLLSAGCDGVTSVVSHKLGDEAGELTGDGLGVAQDAVASASNVRKAGLKSVAKATLKETAKKTVS